MSKSLYFLLSTVLLIRISYGQSIPDLLPESAIRYLDSNPPGPINVSRVMLPNGKSLAFQLDKLKLNRRIAEDATPQEVLSDIITKFSEQALDLIDDQKHSYAAGPDPNKQPKQTGLGYNLGSRDFQQRHNMHVSGGNDCKLEVYALDCSAFIFQIFEKVGCKGMNLSAYDQAQTKTLDQTISFVTSKLKSVDAGKIAASQIQNGDIIYWSKLNGEAASHIGIALKEGNIVKVFQSNGTGKSCDNLSDTRGPRTFDLNNTYWFSTSSDWKVLRYVEK